MSEIMQNENSRLIRTCGYEKLCIEPWGRDSLRVRATRDRDFTDEHWALLPPEESSADVSITGDAASIRNGKIYAEISDEGDITFYRNDGKMILKEYVRNRNHIDRYCSTLSIAPRDLRPIIGGDYSLTARFESVREEKIYGMGQYQQEFLNLKGCVLELAHRNSQASVPFALSDQGYGFLWNNPAIGQADFANNVTIWTARATKELDYWITAGDTPSEIVESYARATGTVPMMPEYGMGFWQCKLRYQTQDELLAVAREYKRRGIPVDVIVIDFFHWTRHGEWKFDLDYWPDPEGMIKELKEMGIEAMVSIWPTVDHDSENFGEMQRKGFLVRNDRGIDTHMEFLGNSVFFDATNPGAREYIWDKAKKNYYDKGIQIFWLDEAEPEYGGAYDYDLYRYYSGTALQTGNTYPAMFAKAFFDGMKAEGQENILNLVRCVWAGSQRYGALAWSGDIHSSFRALREQFGSGLNMGLAGIPWWTTDIGGFLGGYPEDKDFQELLIRWFQYGAFSPVFRLHGERMPHKEPLGNAGGGQFFSGSDNEIWSFGEKAYEICRKYILLRERLRPYIRGLMQAAHEKGSPVIRTLFYEFPTDQKAWEIEDQYMFGDKLLVAPILHENMRSREVYLPVGSTWKNAHTGVCYAGGTTVTTDAPIDIIPLFLRDNAQLPITQ